VSTTSSQLLNKDELKLWILRHMGAPLIKVEITDGQLEDVIEDARRWFSAKKGVKRQLLLAVNSGKSQYELPEEVDTVLDVAHPSSVLDFSLLLSPFTFLDEQQIPYQIYAAPRSGGLYSTLAQAIQSVGIAKRVMGAEQDWRQDGCTLSIFPVPKNEGAMLLDYKSNVFTLEQLKERDHDLIKRFSLAHAMRIVGLIRDKFASYPGAQGGVQFNAATLLNRADQELDRLEEEIFQSGFPAGFMMG
jgi:hypothetical protein